SIFPLGTAWVLALSKIDITGYVQNTELALAAITVAGGVIAHGVILSPREGGMVKHLAWIHALAALFLLFITLGSNMFGMEKITTVCWGVSAITLFGVGLAAALKPYRLAGLLGLVFCIGRMFLIDIDDTFYRIVAFFAISLVLMLVGWLYYRFREQIERSD
ncbi:MAG: DUF2339 domain-containing protein, partial [Chthoniobacterales bacterium]